MGWESNWNSSAGQFQMKQPENGFQSKMDLLMTEIDAPLIGGNCNCRVNYDGRGQYYLVVAAASFGKEFLFVSAQRRLNDTQRPLPLFR